MRNQPPSPSTAGSSQPPAPRTHVTIPRPHTVVAESPQFPAAGYRHHGSSPGWPDLILTWPSAVWPKAPPVVAPDCPAASSGQGRYQGWIQVLCLIPLQLGRHQGTFPSNCYSHRCPSTLSLQLKLRSAGEAEVNGAIQSYKSTDQRRALPFEFASSRTKRVSALSRL